MMLSRLTSGSPAANENSSDWLTGRAEGAGFLLLRKKKKPQAR
jgi:hypothetical protein